MLSKNNIELIVDEATSINKEAKTLSTVTHNTISYDKLASATDFSPLSQVM